VLQGLESTTDPILRAQTIQDNIKAIAEEDQKANPELKIEISEMFVGRSYTLFRYIYLQDVRLVMAPPLTIGQFGGDTYNGKRKNIKFCGAEYRIYSYNSSGR